MQANKNKKVNAIKSQLEEKAEESLVANLTFQPEISHRSRRLAERSSSRNSGGKFVEREQMFLLKRQVDRAELLNAKN